MGNIDRRAHIQSLLRNSKRQPVAVSDEHTIRCGVGMPGGDLPLVLTATAECADLAAWVAGNRQEILTLLDRHGAILFRGFDVSTPAALESAATALSGPLLPYVFRSTPRRSVQGLIYTSTEYPADQSIPPHNEMSYTSTWPLFVWFCCLKPAESGGATPLADSRRVLADLDPKLVAEFRTRGVMYTRRITAGLGLSMVEVFGSDDRQEVERFCRSHRIDYEWDSEGGLRIRQVRPATARHPRTGEEIWFNQAHLFHVSALPQRVRDTLLASMREDDLPRNSLFGDGSPIPEASIDAVRAGYARNTRIFQWTRTDALLVDNMLVAHGRNPFAGERSVIVAMSGAGSDGE
jgi:alpha-ketoglutarate-dependent taurine dioxygenase